MTFPGTPLCELQVERDHRDIARPLPHNAEAERSILGAVLLDNEALNNAVELLCIEDFFFPQHRTIFDCMIQLNRKSQPIDLVLMQDHLERLGELEAAGGTPYLSLLADGLPRNTRVDHYARIVKSTSRLRRLAHLTEAIQKEALSVTDLENTNAIIARAAKQVAELGAPTGLTAEPKAWRDVFHSYSDFEDCPPLSFAIDGFLQHDAATMIGGLSGHGKTLIMISLAKALLGPKDALLWGLFRVNQPAERVLYLIPECSLAPFKHRLKLFGIYDCLARNDDRLLVRTLSKGPTPCLSDPRILFAAKDAHVILDTAARFGEGDENSASDNAHGLANDIFALLGSRARSVIAAHHSPKPFAKENVMRLENVLRGSGDVGAMLGTAWGIKQIDRESNIIHIENLKPRDFEPCGPFQIIGRPAIDESGDFRLHKKPGECGALMDEQQPERDKGGAPIHARETRAANIEKLRELLKHDPKQTSEQLAKRFRDAGIQISDVTVRKYRREIITNDSQEERL